MTKKKSKKEKSKALIAVLWTLSVIFSAVIGYYVGQGLDWLHSEPSLEIIMPENPLEDGSFNIELSNTGDIDLEFEKVNIHSCYMDENEWRHYYPDDLPAGKDYTLNFFEKKTANQSLLIDCKNDPLKDWETNRRMTVTVCKDFSTGEVYIPRKNNSFNMCGYCFWKIEVETNKGNFEFNETTFTTIDFAFEILSEEENKNFNMSSSNVSCTDDFKITYYGTRELEIVGEYDG